MGVHARPAAQIVKIASKYKSDVYISKNGREINGKSIMGVMMLAAEMGSELLFKIQGEDEEQAMAALVELVNNKFYEE
jgi:phosphocarrier protein